MSATDSTSVKFFYATISIVVLAFVLLPLAGVIWMSFFANQILSFPPTGYTLAWYARAFQTTEFQSGFIVSLQPSMIATALSLLLGIPASLVLVRCRFPGREAVSMLLMSPMILRRMSSKCSARHLSSAV